MIIEVQSTTPSTTTPDPVLLIHAVRVGVTKEDRLPIQPLHPPLEWLRTVPTTGITTRGPMEATLTTTTCPKGRSSINPDPPGTLLELWQSMESQCDSNQTQFIPNTLYYIPTKQDTDQANKKHWIIFASSFRNNRFIMKNTIRRTINWCTRRTVLKVNVICVHTLLQTWPQIFCHSAKNELKEEKKWYA